MDPHPTLQGWLEGALGYRFKDPDLIETALSHRSLGSPNNERLEFLGDAILNFVVAELIYCEFAQADEGDLSRLRASLVKGETLAAIATSLGLAEHLRLGPGEVRSGGFRRGSILADAFEAILGAIYVDGGFEAARAAILRVMAPRLKELPSAADLKDPKTRLQEFLQSLGKALPVYKVMSTEGKSHLQTFVIRCEIKSFDVVAYGRGDSRRRAEQDAAAQALTETLRRAKLQTDD